MANIPHFDLPFRYVGGAPAVNEQGSVDDITACVYAICVTPPGTRDEMPDFGLNDPAFSQQPIPAHVLNAQIAEWEPRVPILVETAPDRLDTAIADANVIVGGLS